jgi:hypothetical protein
MDRIPMKASGIWLTVLSVAGLCMTPAPTDAKAEPANGPISPGGAEERRDHFRTPIEAVVAFLEAVKAKDAVRLREATFARASTEAIAKNQPLFTAILAQSLSETELAELASRLEGYRVSGMVRPTASGRAKVIVKKPGPNGRQYLRTFTTRWQKETGWKVSDIGEQRERETPIQAR